MQGIGTYILQLLFRCVTIVGRYSGSFENV